MPGLSRRQFLGGAAGAAAVAALPVALSQRTRPALGTHLAGATVDPAAYNTGSYVDAANIFDGYVGLPLAKTLEKIYIHTGAFGTSPPGRMTKLAPLGCEFLVSVAPGKGMTPNERKTLANWLAMLNSAGLTYRVVLYSEANNQAFRDQQTWQTYWSYYAPTIKAAGVPCGYDPGCSYGAIARAEAFFPTNPSPDELWMDYYATSFRAGSRLETIIGMAKAIGISAGMGEWGWSSGNVVFNPMTIPWWNDYCSYLINLAGKGDLALGGMYFNGLAVGNPSYPRVDVIADPNDPRIPGIQNVANAITAG
ncbi:MAG TPA: twin-arginine translocation signal domain-containing protein [Streptosporangiaceae bacterium]|nr:twin-arginine translocation signal domain-containing protein [Streptosporangiaceae bacterium]